MMSGFAMQAAKSSRPASGAEHQFSHLWDMEHHTHQGQSPSHGFKVGIGTLASLALYEELLRQDLARLEIGNIVAAWPPAESLDTQIAHLFDDAALRHVALQESRAKHLTREQLQRQLDKLQQAWPDLREQLTRQLIPFDRAADMLRQAGCPTQPDEIGISRERLQRSYAQALRIRRRYTVLDLAERTGLLESSLRALFGPGGRWS
jgi:glycerol-1-phosphate dehydrogenase [NAD(P)+]